MFADDFRILVLEKRGVRLQTSDFFGSGWIELRDAAGWLIGSYPAAHFSVKILPFWEIDAIRKSQHRRLHQDVLQVRCSPRPELPKARGLRGILVDGLRRLASAIESYGKAVP